MMAAQMEIKVHEIVEDFLG